MALPGGLLKGENVENTLVREVKEETNRDVQVGSIQPSSIRRHLQKENGQWNSDGYQVRLLVFVIKIMNSNLIQTEILLSRVEFRLKISQNILIVEYNYNDK